MEVEHIMLWGESDKGKYYIYRLYVESSKAKLIKKESEMVATTARVLGNGMDIVWEYKFATSAK